MFARAKIHHVPLHAHGLQRTLARDAWIVVNITLSGGRSCRRERAF